MSRPAAPLQYPTEITNSSTGERDPDQDRACPLKHMDLSIVCLNTPMVGHDTAAVCWSYRDGRQQCGLTNYTGSQITVTQNSELSYRQPWGYMMRSSSAPNIFECCKVSPIFRGAPQSRCLQFLPPLLPTRVAIFHLTASTGIFLESLCLLPNLRFNYIHHTSWRPVS